MKKKENYSEIIFRSSKALNNVAISKYSISAPIGKPYDSLDILTFFFSKAFFIYKIVVSPSIDDFKASINSGFSSDSTLFINDDKLISSIPTSSIGEIKPFKT